MGAGKGIVGGRVVGEEREGTGKVWASKLYLFPTHSDRV